MHEKNTPAGFVGHAGCTSIKSRSDSIHKARSQSAPLCTTLLACRRVSADDVEPRQIRLWLARKASQANADAGKCTIEGVLRYRLSGASPGV